MSHQDRRSSLVERSIDIDHCLDNCPDEEPDSMIYDPDFCNETATIRAQQKLSELEGLYRFILDTYTKIGLPQKAVEQRLVEYDDYWTTYVDVVRNDAQKFLDKLCQRKENLIKDIQKMTSDLYLPVYIPEENITLLQHCKRLKTKFNELNIVKQKRMVKLQELRDKQTRHCLVLGIKAPQIKTLTDIPTEEELNKLQSTVLELEKEEKRRKDKFILLKDAILKWMTQLEYEPQTEFEQDIRAGKPIYTESHILKMTDLHSKLEDLHAKNLEEFKKLKSRLLSLYERLDVSKEEQEKLFDEHTVCTPTLLLEMQVEVERYEELKRQNIGKFIQKIKDELVVEYERCYISQEQQDSFLALSNVPGECNEALLELYEREFERIQNYYEDNKEILEKIQKMRNMWSKLIELEVKANDPKRFNNRGGQLLQEEKDRKALQRGLPKIEKELLALNEKYSEKNQGSKFKIYDSELDVFIDGCWDELNAVKEEQKRERQQEKAERARMTNPAVSKGRKPQQAQIIVKRTPTKRPAGAGITPTPSKLQCQRSVLGTPSNTTYRSNQLTMSSSVKKPVRQPIAPQTRSNVTKMAQQLSSNGKSNIPVPHLYNQINIRDKKKANSDGSDISAVSLSEQEFEDMIVACPASDLKRSRQ